MRLKDQVAVVTGASRGIGKAAAIALAEEGAHVVCTARSSDATPAKLPGTIDETVRQIEALGHRALAVTCDIYRDEQVEAMAQQTLAEFGRVDILVNNAAVNYFTSFLETTMKRWDVVLGVNFRGALLCKRAFLPEMIQQGGGRIINVSSGIAVEPWQAVKLGNHPYFVSKVALEGLTRSLAEELGPYNVAVNCLRVDLMVASEGAFFHNPDAAAGGQSERMVGTVAADVANWEPPEVAAEAIMWLATRPLQYTGHIVGINEARWGASRSG
jgi:NAD(P)-dependent dehydrogenase (short-subunit alcohol dehydrogenase family)